LVWIPLRFKFWIRRNHHIIKAIMLMLGFSLSLERKKVKWKILDSVLGQCTLPTGSHLGHFSCIFGAKWNNMQWKAFYFSSLYSFTICFSSFSLLLFYFKNLRTLWIIWLIRSPIIDPLVIIKSAVNDWNVAYRRNWAEHTSILKQLHCVGVNTSVTHWEQLTMSKPAWWM